MHRKQNEQSGSVKMVKSVTIMNRCMGIAIAFIITGCAPEPQIEAAFSYSYLNDNEVRFLNESSGDYYSASWDFGNGTTNTTTNKKEVFDIYYPNAGNYKVDLKILDYMGNTDTTSKTISIATSDLQLSFTAVIDQEKPNYVMLTNTTEGAYNSYLWVYRNMEVENVSPHEAYFPKAGSYDVELKVLKNGNTFSLEKTVIITQDDPGYIEGMVLVWSDEFEGVTVNSDNWTFETGASGWGNNELQNYTSSGNAGIVDGKLVITARKVNEDKTVGSYTSARMISKGKQEFMYGRIEISAKLPAGTGLWPAIWMMGGNISSVGWPACGEMDIMEYVGYQPNTIHSTVHTPSGYAGNGDGSSKTLTTAEEEFHIYGLIWNEQELIFYTDTPENVTHIYAPAAKTEENWPFDQSAFFLLNIAVGGTWGGAQGIDNTIFPQSMEIDYVRVYQEPQ
jgi:beta-glucanase (GH16 family)